MCFKKMKIGKKKSFGNTILGCSELKCKSSMVMQIYVPGLLAYGVAVFTK